MQSHKCHNDLGLFPRQTIQNHSNPSNYSNPSQGPATNVEVAEVDQFYEDRKDLIELTPKKDVLFIKGDWNAKVESQELPLVTGKSGLGVQNQAGQKLTNSFVKRTHWSLQTSFSNNTRDKSTHGHHQMVNTKIRLI